MSDVKTSLTVTARAALMRPAPDTASKPASRMSSAVARRTWRTSSLVSEGWLATMRADSPETCGAAIDVPACRRYSVPTINPLHMDAAHTDDLSDRMLRNGW